MSVAPLELIGRDRKTGRPLFVIEAGQAADVPETILVPGPHFVCIIAWDSKDVPVATVGELAERLLQTGCVYVCCWGPGSSRVEDIFDETHVVLELDSDRGVDGPCIMTTAHETESLASAIYFALRDAWPDEAFAATFASVVGISIGSKLWADEIRQAFQDPASFCDRVAAADGN